MSSRSSRVRTKVVALLASLIALWAFAAFVTIRDGVNLLSVNALDTAVGRPTESLVDALQQERRATLIFVGGHTTEQRAALATQRASTDEAAAAFRREATGSTVSWAGSEALAQRVADVLNRLDDLDRTRQAIDGGAMTRNDAARAYTATLDAGFLIYGSLATLDDPDIAKDGRTLVSLTRAQEVLAQEDALLSGALAAKELSAAEQAQFVQLVGVQRFLLRDVAAELPEPDATTFRELTDGATFARFRTLEDALIQRGSGTTALPAVAADWTSATDPVISQLRGFVLTAADNLIGRATPAAVGVIVRLALAGGLGLLAVIASIVISVTTARALVRQLERLRNAARDLASYRLPRVVERLQHGEKVDVDAEAPPLDFGRDEIGQVGQAFNDVQSTAIRVAVEQAELRRSVRDVFLSLARRSQALLHRQLGLLDAMERRASDAEELAELFRIDHLATRMRRNAENLIVLSGATAGRAWRKPVPMVDVLRGALAEVEDYTRVTVLPVVPASLVGRAVGDVIHLLAELIENAVSFSPPQTVVRVGGSVVGNGFAIEIEDRGLGMSDEDRALANAQLNDPPEFKLSSTARLGLYVVGKLSERHGIRVKLTESPYGGTTAIVLLPATLMADGPDSPPDTGETDLAGAAPWAALTPGRHRNDVNGGQPALPGLAALPAGTTVGAAPSALTAPVLAEPSGAAWDESPLSAPALIEAALIAPALIDPEQLDAVALNGTYVPPSFVTTVVAATDEPAGQTGVVQAGAGVAEAGAAEPAAAGTDRRGEPTILTPAGLPWRQRDRTPRDTTLAGTPTGDGAGHDNGQPVGVAADSPASATTPDPAPTMPTTVPTTVGAPIGRAGRGPEEVRSIMSSYRSGTLRGRIDAARLTDPHHTPEWTDTTQDPHGTEMNEEG